MRDAQVRSVPVTTTRIELGQLRVLPPRVEEVQSVESSMRLDAIASAGARLAFLHRALLMQLFVAALARFN